MIHAKRILCVVLAAVLLLGCAPAADAAGRELTRSGSQIPIVLVGGDGEKLVDADGRELFRFIDITKYASGMDDGNLKESVLNVVRPLLIQGMLTNNFEPYYEALYNEIAEMFEPVLPDHDGNPRNGTNVDPWRLQQMADSLKQDYKQTRGWYDLFDYHFYYDWRLDPMETAVKLHDYIEQVKALTGSEKVAIVCRCVGSAVVLAYIAQYGAGSIYALGMDGITGNGAEPLSESISGKFAVNGAAINRLLIDLDALGMLDIDPFVNETLDLLVKSGMLDATKNTLKIMLYYRILEGATSAIARSTFFACPMYWSTVTPEDWDAAMYNVFGPEGSEMRQEYKGLIEKIENYHEKVGLHVRELMQQVKDAGANVAIIAKYGYQMSPVCESADMLADQIISVKRASFGATTSLVYDTLAPAYVTERTVKGMSRYISPDLQIDASTCLFPDSTWFVKGVRHSEWTATENAIMYTVTTAETQLTVNDFDLSQFIVGDYQTGECEKMTYENCDTYHWKAADQPANAKTPLAKIKAFFTALRVWWDSLKRILKERQEKA